MERLTIPDVRVDEHATRRTMIDVEAVREHAMDFYWRLKAYEDTWLTPEEIDMDHEAAEQLRRLCRGYDLGRLVNLAEADRDGRVVVLPCKVGNTLWVTGRDNVPREMELEAPALELFARTRTTYVCQRAIESRTGSARIVCVMMVLTSARPYSSPARKRRKHWRR